MNNSKKPNAEHVWKQLEDFLVPRLALSVIDRAVYSHLLRHSRLEGKLRLSFSIAWLARGARLSNQPTRQAVRRLISQGALHLVERSKSGHVIEVRLPEEIPGVSAAASPADRLARHSGACLSAQNLEDMDFLQTKFLRQAIHSRERGLCFYCLRKLNERVQCLDHVVPQVDFGRNSYRNLVSACLECNSRKGETPAPDFLRWLYRERRITATELTARLRALDALAAGKLRPVLATSGNPPPRRGRPPLHLTTA
ncbi:MAG TPA: HNH endonuclease [Candidatus Dormibacteraeota bacterium]|nr:HNH endonuclease [Candidatus Dormibacteraeota bacterium]